MKVKQEDLHHHSIDIIEDIPMLDHQQKSNEKTPSHSNSDFKIKTEEEWEIELEDLHHSIDIKEETSMKDSRVDQDCEIASATHPQKPKPFECKVCGYKCSRKGNFNQHLLTHMGEKPHGCNVCDYKCYKKAYLKIHLLSHTGEKPHKCNICDYKCSHKGSLKTHYLRMHTKHEKLYKCNICDFKSSYKAYLKTHYMRMHIPKHENLNMSKYKCNICDFKTNHKTILKNHLALVHNLRHARRRGKGSDLGENLTQ